MEIKNDIISKFMNVEPMNWNPSHSVRDYHNDWRKLMHVVDSIENDYYLQVDIVGYNCFIHWMGAEPDDPVLLSMLQKFNGIDEDAPTKLESTYTAVIKFIEYLNERKV